MSRTDCQEEGYAHVGRAPAKHGCHKRVTAGWLELGPSFQPRTPDPTWLLTFRVLART